MSFIAMSQNLDMGGSDTGTPVGPATAGRQLMLVFVGRIVPIALAIEQLLAHGAW